MNAPPLFAFEDVRWSGDAPDGHGRGAVLDGVTAEVGDRGITCLLGPSGAGKSTLLRLCNRLVVPDSGTVRFRGDDLAGLDPLALRRRVGMVFQRPTLFGGTVRDNLTVARPDGTDADFAAALGRAQLSAGFLERASDELSGGEAQRACLARTLVTGPEVLLMDEPTSALDPASRRALEGLARRLADDGVPLLWVTHDLAQAERIADDVLVVVRGRVAVHGSMADVHACPDPAVRRFLAEGGEDGEDRETGEGSGDG